MGRRKELLAGLADEVAALGNGSKVMA